MFHPSFANPSLLYDPGAQANFQNAYRTDTAARGDEVRTISVGSWSFQPKAQMEGMQFGYQQAKTQLKAGNLMQTQTNYRL